MKGTQRRDEWGDVFRATPLSGPVAQLRSSSAVLKQSLAAILLSIATDIVTGVILHRSGETLLLLPGLILLIPAAIGLRGNIFSSLGSRLGSALHLGSLKRFTHKNAVVQNNVYGALTLNIIFSVFVAFIAKAVLAAFGLPSISVFSLVLISFIGGMLSGIILLAITFGIALKSYERGWDPDNLTSPMISALGDLFTTPCLLIAAFFVSGLGNATEAAAFAVLLIFLVTLVLFFRSGISMKALFRHGSYHAIVAQSAPIIIVALLLDSLAGLFIHVHFASAAAVPLLIIALPAFLEEGGNLGTILASRLSTKLHLGSMKPRLALSREIKKEFITSYFLALMIFPIVGVASYLTAGMLSIPALPLWKTMEITLIAGFALTTLITVLSFVVSIVSFRYNVDPDNVTIPLITSAADLIGVLSLLLTVKLLGVI